MNTTTSIRSRRARRWFLNTTFEVVPTVTLHAGARFTKDQVAIRNLYALEGGPATPPVGYTPDGLTTAYWTQTIGALPATYTHYQTGVAAQGPTLSRDEDNTNVSFRAGADWKVSERRSGLPEFQPGLPRRCVQRQARQLPGRGELSRLRKSSIRTKSA